MAKKKKPKKEKAKKTKKVKKAKRSKRKVSKKKKTRKVAKKKTGLPEEAVHRTRMRIIGVGGGGGSIVSEIAPQISRIDFVVANTDQQALKTAARQTRKFGFGQNLTQGLGCGMDPKLGQKAAKEGSGKIVKLFQGIDLAIIVASLGGGTGSGAAPEFAKIAKEMGVITVGIFTMPFKFEGSRRSQIAKNSLEKLTPNLNVVSIIPNENIFKIIDKNTPLKESFSSINKKLAENLRGLIEMVYLPGLINIDFADLKTILNGKGKLAYLNSVAASGPNRAEEAVKDLLRSPLNEYSIQGAEKIVFSITAPQALGMHEVEYISRTISDFNRRAKIIFGVSQDNSYKDKIRVTLLAVGCGRQEKKKKKSKPKPKPEPEPEPESKPEPKKKSPPRRRQLPRGAKTSKPRKKLKSRPKKKSRKIRAKKKPVQKKAKAKIRKPVFKAEKPAAHTQEKTEAPKPPTRKNALELKKEAEKTEEDMFEQEKKWDIPAFLKRRESE